MKDRNVLKVVIIVASILVMLTIIKSIEFKKPQLGQSDSVNLNNWVVNNLENKDKCNVELPWRIENHSGTDEIIMYTTVPQGQIYNPSILIKMYMKDFDVYIDDKKIYSHKIDANDQKMMSNELNLALIDLTENYKGKRLILKLKDSPYVKYKNEGVVQWAIMGDKTNILTTVIKKEKIDDVIAISMIFIGVCFIILFISAFFTNRGYTNLLCIGIFSILCGGWIISRGVLFFTLHNNFKLSYILEYLSFYSIPIPLLIFIKETYDVKSEKLLNLLIGVFSVFLLISSILQILNIVPLHRLIRVSHILFLSCALTATYILIKGFIFNSKEFIIFFIGFISMTLISIFDLINFYKNGCHRSEYYVKIGMLIFIITLVISVGIYIINLKNIEIREKITKRLAYTDINTGLKNRLSFEERMRGLSQNIVNGSNICIIVFDLNNLKVINDSLGHLYGDKLIIDAAIALKYAYSSIGDIFRIGGDEFVVIIVGKNKSDIKKAEKRLHKYIQKNNSKDELKIHLSYGKANFKYGEDKELSCVFKRADEQMYIHKKISKKNGTYDK